MLALCFLQYPLLTLMVFDEWQNGILVAFIVMAKVKKLTFTQFSKYYQNVCQAIGCLMLSLLTMFKLKSMCWGLISLNPHTIPCLLLVYYSAYFVAKPNNLANHFLLHIIFWHKLCLFYRTLVFVKTCSISCLLDIHKHFIKLLE
jgi:hypothetical protein